MSQWYQAPAIGNIGVPDSFGGFPKPDINYQLPANYPITAIASGTVTGIDTMSSWGCSITIQLDNPLNQLATHVAYLHLSGFANGLQVGSHVNAGDLIGYNGGANACGSQKVPLGLAFYSGDNYGFGAAWTTLENNLSGALNPIKLLQQLGLPTSNITGSNNYNGSGIVLSSGSQNSSNPLDILAGWLAPVTNVIGGAQGIQSWLQPTRLLKMLLGMALLFIVVYTLLTDKVAPVVEQGVSKAAEIGLLA